MSGHTPGPWTTKRAQLPVDGAFDHAIIASGTVIAEAFGRSGVTIYHDSEANARLIAAAPDLLAACRQALASLEWTGIGDVPSVRTVEREIRAAIAKAEGR